MIGRTKWSTHFPTVSRQLSLIARHSSTTVRYVSGGTRPPIDLFLDTTDFHVAAGSRVRWERFAGIDVPFLACADLAVFKAFFDRTRDWADLEEMAAAGTLDTEAVVGVLATYLGADDARIARLRLLATLT